MLSHELDYRSRALYTNPSASVRLRVLLVPSRAGDGPAQPIARQLLQHRDPGVRPVARI